MRLFFLILCTFFLGTEGSYGQISSDTGDAVCGPDDGGYVDLNGLELAEILHLENPLQLYSLRTLEFAGLNTGGKGIYVTGCTRSTIQSTLTTTSARLGMTLNCENNPRLNNRFSISFQQSTGVLLPRDVREKFPQRISWKIPDELLAAIHSGGSGKEYYEKWVEENLVAELVKGNHVEENFPKHDLVSFDFQAFGSNQIVFRPLLSMSPKVTGQPPAPKPGCAQ